MRQDPSPDPLTVNVASASVADSGAPSDIAVTPFAAIDAEIYGELKRIARHHLRTRAADATISTTELVHDAYLKFSGSGDPRWQNRAHFFGSASRAMRQVLVDYARHWSAQKRGNGDAPRTLTGSDASLVDHSDLQLEMQVDDLLVLDDALRRLRAVDERLCRVVELRFFAGLPEEEIGGMLGVSTRTVGRDWIKARLFLARELGRAGS